MIAKLEILNSKHEKKSQIQSLLAPRQEDRAKI